MWINTGRNVSLRGESWLQNMVLTNCPLNLGVNFQYQPPPHRRSVESGLNATSGLFDGEHRDLSHGLNERDWREASDLRSASYNLLLILKR
jgi:hypothetical protein